MYGPSCPLRAELSTVRVVRESSTSIDWHVNGTWKKTEGIWYAWGGGGAGGAHCSNLWVPYLPDLENPNFPIPASFSFCNITRNLLKLLFWMHMHFAYFLFYFSFPHCKTKKWGENSPILYPRALYDPPKNKQTNKTQTKIGEKKKLTLISLKWSPIAPFISIYSQKIYISPGKAPDSHLQEVARSSLYI